MFVHVQGCAVVVLLPGTPAVHVHASLSVCLSVPCLYPECVHAYVCLCVPACVRMCVGGGVLERERERERERAS